MKKICCLLALSLSFCWSSGGHPVNSYRDASFTENVGLSNFFGKRPNSVYLHNYNHWETGLLYAFSGNLSQPIMDILKSIFPIDPSKKINFNIVIQAFDHGDDYFSLLVRNIRPHYAIFPINEDQERSGQYNAFTNFINARILPINASNLSFNICSLNPDQMMWGGGISAHPHPEGNTTVLSPDNLRLDYDEVEDASLLFFSYFKIEGTQGAEGGKPGEQYITLHYVPKKKTFSKIDSSLEASYTRIPRDDNPQTFRRISNIKTREQLFDVIRAHDHSLDFSIVEWLVNNENEETLVDIIGTSVEQSFQAKPWRSIAFDSDQLDRTFKSVKGMSVAEPPHGRWSLGNPDGGTNITMREVVLETRDPLPSQFMLTLEALTYIPENLAKEMSVEIGSRKFNVRTADNSGETFKRSIPVVLNGERANTIKFRIPYPMVPNEHERALGILFKKLTISPLLDVQTLHFPADVRGLSVIENDGNGNFWRWSDKNLSHEVYINFESPLPNHFNLELDLYQLCDQNEGLDLPILGLLSDGQKVSLNAKIKLSKGKQRTTVIVPEAYKDNVIGLILGDIPHSWDGDRKLGIAISRLSVIPA